MSDLKMLGAGNLIVWRGVWDKQIVAPVFIDTSLNAEMYLDKLEDKSCQPWWKRMGNSRRTFSMTRHHRLVMVSACAVGSVGISSSLDRLPWSVEWPSRSPDFNPLYFCLWEQLNIMVYQMKIQNMDGLKERIADACTLLTPDVLKRVRHEWERRIRICYQCYGAHIEHVLLIKKLFYSRMGTSKSPCIIFNSDMVIGAILDMLVMSKPKQQNLTVLSYFCYRIM